MTYKLNPTKNQLRAKNDNLPRAPLQDLTGKKFGHLLVLGEGNRLMSPALGRRVWVCACECGTFRILGTYKLTSDAVKSCGCMQHDFGKAKNKQTNTPVKARKPEKRQPDALDFFFGRV